MEASLWEQKQITKACFGGSEPRDCSRCPANQIRGGICCFGDPDKHDPSDDDCQECLHFEECRQEVIDTEELRIEEEAKAQEEYHSRFDPRWGSAKKRKRVIKSRPTVRVTKEEDEEDSQLVQIGRRRDLITSPEEYKRLRKKEFKKKLKKMKLEQYLDEADFELEEYEKTVEGLFNRFCKDTAWGAGQGFFEMGAEFFRTHRLP